LLGIVAALVVALALLAPATVCAAETNLTEGQAISIADDDPKVAEQRSEHPKLKPTAKFEDGNWKVDYLSGPDSEVQVIVDDATGTVRESWTGDQVAWTMARGYSGTFGHKLNAPYVWLPLCALFLLGLVDWRRPWRVANLDLVVLLAFGASHFFFNRAEIGVSVPLAYPPLLYLMGRMVWIGLRGRGEGLRPVWPAAWLMIAALFLLGFRGGLNIADSGVIDVGYAGVVGADRIADGEPLYGEGGFPKEVGSGDTYGPVNYYAYVPFEQALPWGGSWDDLPAAHAAAIFFDLATFAGLVLLGRRLRPGSQGRRLGAVLGFGWAAYPYTAFVMQSNSNDSLVALLVVGLLLALARPAARGALLALAGLTKFAPLILAPMLATFRATAPALRRFALGGVAAAAVVMGATLLDPGLGTFWDRTVSKQIDRESPFSVWGQVPSLEPLRIGLIVALGALAALLAFRPRDKSVVQVTALTAALLIGTQLIAQHWFYLYLVWFLPPLLAALGAVTPLLEPGSARSTPPAHRGRSKPRLPSPTRPLRRSRSESASA
jgi:hypothetical protein